MIYSMMYDYDVDIVYSYCVHVYVYMHIVLCYVEEEFNVLYLKEHTWFSQNQLLLICILGYWLLIRICAQQHTSTFESGSIQCLFFFVL